MLLMPTETAPVMLQAPTSPLGPGIMQDTYSDRLDIMACCKGDYSLHNRILSGWVPASERVTLGLLDIATPTTPTSAAGSAANSSEVVRHFVLWPYDRPESKGQLKGVSLRLEDGKVLVLGYRCAGAYGVAERHSRRHFTRCCCEYNQLELLSDARSWAAAAAAAGLHA